MTDPGSPRPDGDDRATAGRPPDSAPGPATGGAAGDQRPRSAADAPGDHGAEPTRLGWAQRRRERIAAEVARNRRGEYTVPTWVLALALVLVVGGWLTLVLLS